MKKKTPSTGTTTPTTPEPSPDFHLVAVPKGYLRYQGVGSPTGTLAKALILHRRDLVSQLYLTGKHTAESIVAWIRDNCGETIGVGTIHDDLKKMRQQWQDNALRNTNDHVTNELAKLDNLESLLLEQLVSGSLNTVDYATESVRIAKRRAALLGLDKAQKLVVDDRRTADLDDAELESIILDFKKQKEEESTKG